MADYLSTFYKESQKKNKGDVSGFLNKRIGKAKDNQYDFYDTFASSGNKELAKQISTTYSQREKQKTQLLDKGLNAGMSWEDISGQTGVPLDQVQSYSEQTRPDYGKGPSLGERIKKLAVNNKDLPSKILKYVVENPSISDVTRNELLKKANSQNADKVIGTLAGGTEKVIDSARALTGIAAKEQQRDDNLLREGKISRQEYMKRNEIRLQDTAWAGTQDKGLGDRLKKSAGVSLQATSEIAPFVGGIAKGAKAAEGALAAAKEVGQSFAGNAAFGGVASTGRQLAENGKVDVKSLLKESLVSGGLGVAGTGVGIGSKAISSRKLNASGGSRQLDEVMKRYEVARNTGDTATMKQIEAAVPDKAMLGISTGKPTVDPVTGKIVAGGTGPEPTLYKQPGLSSQEIYLKQQQYLANGRNIENVDDLSSIAKNSLQNDLKGMKKGGIERSGARVENATAKPVEYRRLEDGSIVIQDGRHTLEYARRNGITDYPMKDVTNDFASPLERISNIDEKLLKTKNPEKAAALAIERKSIVESLPAPERKLAVAATDVSRMAAQTEVPTLARKTEERAIVKGLTTGFEDLPTDVRANFAAQRSAVNDLMKTNADDVLDVALGRKPAPQGIEAAHFYRAAEDKAIKEGDVLTLQTLASKSALPQQAREAGRAIGAYGYKDPNSPVDAIREINTLRQAAEKRGIKIPSNVVTTEETKNIVDLAKAAEQKKNVWLDAGGKIDDASRLEYGRAQVAFRNKINDLKLEASKQTLKEKGIRGIASDIAGNTKSLQSSMDNSALFRQGWKTLWTNPGKWAKNSTKTWSDIVKTFGGKNTLDELAADIVSRPNADLYKKAKLAVGIDEEAFPASLGERIPLIGRAYKASEAAYTGFLQRQRVDIFDKYIDIASKSGVELDKKQLESIGKMVNSLTGRGHLGKVEPIAGTLNNVFFSPRMLKSNFDVLTAQQFQKGVTPFVRKQAAKNLLKIASGTATVLAIADIVKPGSVEWDSRSSNFGKIKVGNTRFDVTGGMGSVTTLASRIARWSKKSSTTGDVKSLTGGGFGQSDAVDLVIDFFENKLSPAAGVLRDVARGEDFNGNKPSAGNIAKNLITPLSIQNFMQAKQPNAVDPLIALIADGLGISANSYSSSPNWKVDSSKELKAFQSKVGKEKFNEAYQKFNKEYSDWYAKTEGNTRFKKLSNEDKQLVRTNKAKELRTNVLKDYNFDYKTESKPRGRLSGF